MLRGAYTRCDREVPARANLPSVDPFETCVIAPVLSPCEILPNPGFFDFIPYSPVQLNSLSARSRWWQHNVPTAMPLVLAANMAGIYHTVEFYRQPTTDEQRPTTLA